METLDPQLVVILATAGSALFMATAGVQKNALEWKRRRRVCPGCGRRIDGRTCGCAAG